jgi:polar amino acid transport system substrate-binding protein
MKTLHLGGPRGRITLPAALIALAALFLAAPLAAERPQLMVATNQAPPYRVLVNGVWAGLYFEVFDLLAQRAGFTYQVIEAPVARGLKLLQDGAADVMLGPLRTAEREAYLQFTAAAFPAERKVFYVRPGSPAIRDWVDLRGRTVSLLKGGAYSPRFDGDHDIIKDELSDYLSAVRKVAAKRSDAVLMPELQGDTLLREAGIELEKSSLVIEGAPSYIVFSRLSRHLDLIPALEKAMAQFQADGTIDRLVAKYRKAAAILSRN